MMVIPSQGPASVEDRAMALLLPPPHMTPPSSPSPPPPPRPTQVPPQLPHRHTLAPPRAAAARMTPQARATAVEPSGRRPVAVVPALQLLSPSMDPSGTVSWKEMGLREGKLKKYSISGMWKKVHVFNGS